MVGSSVPTTLPLGVRVLSEALNFTKCPIFGGWAYLAKVRQVALSVCGAGTGYMTEPAPSVVVTALNDYNVAMLLSVWLADETTHIAARFALRERRFEALRAASVDMPFETLALVPAQAGKVSVAIDQTSGDLP